MYEYSVHQTRSWNELGRAIISEDVAEVAEVEEELRDRYPGASIIRRKISDWEDVV